MRVGTLIKLRWNGYIGVITQQGLSTSDFYDATWLIHFINREGYRWCSERDLEVLCK